MDRKASICCSEKTYLELISQPICTLCNLDTGIQARTN